MKIPISVKYVDRLVDACLEAEDVMDAEYKKKFAKVPYDLLEVYKDKTDVIKHLVRTNIMVLKDEGVIKGTSALEACVHQAVILIRVYEQVLEVLNRTTKKKEVQNEGLR